MSLFGSALGAIGSGIGSSLFGGGSDDAMDEIYSGPFVSVGQMGWGAKRNAYENVFGLSPEMLDMYNTYMGQAGMFNDQLSQYLAPSKDDFWGYSGAQPTKTMDDFRDEMADTGDYKDFGYGNINHVLERDAQDAYDEYMGGFDKVFNSDEYEKAMSEWVSPEQQMYNELSRLSAPDEQLADQALENRLFSQGMLTSTGGANRLNAREDAKLQNSLNREQMSKSYVQNLMGSLQTQGTNALNSAMAIGQIPLQYYNAGLGNQAQQIQAGIARAPYAAAPGYNDADAISGFFGELGGSWGSGGSGGTSDDLMFNWDDFSFSGGGDSGWGII